MTHLFRASQSKIKSWRKCKAQAHFKYVESLRPFRKSRPLQFGSIIHSMIEAKINGNDPFEVLGQIDLENHKLFSSEREMYGDIIADIENIMTEYFKHWRRDGLTYIRVNKKKAEHKFEIEWEGMLLLEGKIDAAAKSKRLKWLVEHKSFKRRPSVEDQWRSIQSGFYTECFSIMGWGELDGTMWDMIWSRPPARPGLLQSGAMSKKNIVTLPGTIRDTIEEFELDPKDYKAFIKQSEDHRGEYFQRRYQPIKKKVAKSVFNDLIKTAKEMADLLGKRREKSIDLHCSYCDYSEICRAELTGGDVDYVKEKNYYVGEEGDHYEDPERSTED